MINTTINYLVLTCAVVFVWYAGALFYSVKKSGLDPTLLTYLSPLRFGKFWLGDVSLISVLILLLADHPAASFCGWLLCGFAGTQVFLLYIFGRTGTQPTGYFLVVTLASIAAIGGLPWICASLTALCFIVLGDWQHNHTQYYNRWVSRKVWRLHQRSTALAQTMTAKEWFFVLHIAVTEDIARPKVVRYMEVVYFYLKRPPVISTGIMQVRAKHPLSDTESMRRGATMVQAALASVPAGTSSPQEELQWIAKHYNGSTAYTKHLHATYPGLRLTWDKISRL